MFIYIEMSLYLCFFYSGQVKQLTVYPNSNDLLCSLTLSLAAVWFIYKPMYWMKQLYFFFSFIILFLGNMIAPIYSFQFLSFTSPIWCSSYHKKKTYCSLHCYQYFTTEENMESWRRRRNTKNERETIQAGDVTTTFFILFFAVVLKTWRKGKMIHVSLFASKVYVQPYFCFRFLIPSVFSPCFFILFPREDKKRKERERERENDIGGRTRGAE